MADRGPTVLPNFLPQPSSYFLSLVHHSTLHFQNSARLKVWLFLKGIIPELRSRRRNSTLIIERLRETVLYVQSNLIRSNHCHQIVMAMIEIASSNSQDSDQGAELMRPQLEESTLCEICRDVLIGFCQTTESGLLKETIETLDGKARRDCHLCTLFVHMLPDSHKHAIQEYLLGQKVDGVAIDGFVIRYERHNILSNRFVSGIRMVMYLGEPSITPALHPPLHLGLMAPEGEELSCTISL